MFKNDSVNNLLTTSFAVESESFIVGEWNMNIAGNIKKTGNYKYRPSGTEYKTIPNIFDPFDKLNAYTGGTNAFTSVELGYESDAVTPAIFLYSKDKEKMYYSLEDCLKPFRPRSGINKASYFNNRYFSHYDKDMFNRPRYYMPHKDDEFKYWRSYRTDVTSSTDKTTKEYGISKNNGNNVYLIEDAAPFVVYNESVPANRLVIKVQTNVGDVDLGPFTYYGKGTIKDPFYNTVNKTVPSIFDVEYLSEDGKWVKAYSFSADSKREDGSDIFGSNGFLSLEYGLKEPEEYKNTFNYLGEIYNIAMLPTTANIGDCYLLLESQTGIGSLKIWNGFEFESSTPNYGWSIGTEEITNKSRMVHDFESPSHFYSAGDTLVKYREFIYISGIRVVVKSMNTNLTPFELIEMSPRLVIDASDYVESFQITKPLSDLSSSAIPVGQLLASTGSLTLFDNDNAFNPENLFLLGSGSILSKYLDTNIKFMFYEIIKESDSLYHYIPLKSLYTKTIPRGNQQTKTIEVELRDMFFYFESIKAPQLLLTDISLSQAVGILLDSIGFSNYVFKTASNTKEVIIPYFFVQPDKNVAEVLNSLATATQSAMFFDEYNNFVVMTKEYLIDSNNERGTDIVLYGSSNYGQTGVTRNDYPEKLSNIIDIASQNQKVLNSGTISYTKRYIQRTYGSLSQAQALNDKEKTWVYKPTLLWEVSGNNATKSGASTQNYSLSAMPLNSNLAGAEPTVINHRLINNIIDFGESISFISKFQGYFYANAEIIKYDAVEYFVSGTGNVWISSTFEYQKYFSSLPFNGKIYPTGRVRIYTKPFYEQIDGKNILKNGPVAEHGRAQFGTSISEHFAGLQSYWSANTSVRGCLMNSSYLYSTGPVTLPTTEVGAAGVSNAKAEKSTRNGIVKNYLSSIYKNESTIKKLSNTESGTVQSSALVFAGPDFATNENPRDFVSYVYKNLDGAYKHVGTRMRIIGKTETAAERLQSISGGMSYYTIPGFDPTQNVVVGGGSGGISIVNPSTNVGYYFEIAALTSENLSSYTDQSTGEAKVHNVIFYKVKKNAANTEAVPEKMWGAATNILVDTGNFVGQYRIVGEENPTVYDLSIEYVDINKTTRNFYLYINNKLVNIVTDTDPLPIVNNSVGLFVRGSTKIMFENVYALTKNYADNAVYSIDAPISSVFTTDQSNSINVSEALTKYSLSGMIQKTYIEGISPNSTTKYKLYYDEFGTIMRECAYFNVRYDKAYPALFAKIAPTFTRIRNYVVSGFTAGSYGAEFLLFNTTDSMLYLDGANGNYLRIIGIAFTQDTTHTLTVDEYYNKKGNLSDIELATSSVISSPQKALKEYNEIKNSRIKYGKSDFSIDSEYIQDEALAEDIIGWVSSTGLSPKLSIGVDIFPTPTIQLGDIVSIDYFDANGIYGLTSPDKRFVVYNIEYSKGVGNHSMTVYLSEV